MKKQVMTTAHKIKHHYNSFADALRAAWKIVKLHLGRTVNLSFAKSTGEVRTAVAVAVGTLSTIEKGFVRFVEKVSKGKTQWRSFRLERLIF